MESAERWAVGTSAWCTGYSTNGTRCGTPPLTSFCAPSSTAFCRSRLSIAAPSAGRLEALIPPEERSAPIVTVHDAASHALAFLGGAFGAPVVALGVDQFGQSGTRDELYAFAGIDADSIVGAALLALDIRTP